MASDKNLQNGNKVTLDYHGRTSVDTMVESALKSPTTVVKSSAEESYESANDFHKKTKDIQEIIGAVGNIGETNFLIKELQKESNRYIASEVFFKGDGKYLSIENYMKDQEALGVYKGYTRGIDKAYSELINNPERFYMKGSNSIDEKKLLEFIQNKDVNGTPFNSGFRKRADRATEFIELHGLEEKMREAKGIFSPSQLKILQNNNQIFRFKSLKDFEAAQGIIDTYLLHNLNNTNLQILGAAKKELGDLPLAFKKGGINLDILKRMREKDIKKAIKSFEALGQTDIVSIFRAKSLLSHSSKKMKGLVQHNAVGSALNILGVNQLMSMEGAEGLSYLKTSSSIALTSGRILKGSASIAAATGRNILKETPLGELKNPFFGASEKILGGVSDRLNHSFAGNTIRLLKKVNVDITYQARQNFFLRLFGKLKQQLGKAFHFFTSPIRLLSQSVNFFKKKIIMPIICIFGLFMFFILIIANSGGGGGATASSAVSVILSDKEQLEEFQTTYDALDSSFSSQISGIINGYAHTTNLKGEQIHFGINEPDEYKNGVFQKFFYDGNATQGISSNIGDCISCLVVMMQNNQSQHREEAKELLTALYKSTHSYSTSESALYPGTKGCRDATYFCNENKPQVDLDSSQVTKYWSTDLKYNPWLYGDLYSPTKDQECEVCRAKGDIPYSGYAGCTVTGTCYHGDGGNMGRSYGTCSHYQAVYSCPGHEYEDRTGNIRVRYCAGPLGCEGYYECLGHNHYGCPGHNTYTDGSPLKVCFGHTDLNMNVNIASQVRIFQIGAVPVSEDNSNSTSTLIYGMKEEDFNKLSAEEQEKVAEEWSKKEESALEENGTE